MSRVARSYGMFEVFTRARLDQLLREFPVTAEGAKYIDAALTAPSRNAQGTPFNVVSALPNAKMGFTVDNESKDVERQFSLLRTFDGDCVGFANQPDPVELQYVGRNGKNIRTNYTPDSVGFYKSTGVAVEELKPASQRDKLEELYPGRYYLRNDGSYGSKPAEVVFGRMGIKFSLRFSDEINEVGHRNRQFLHTYLQPHAEKIYLPLYARLSEQMRNCAQASLTDLLESGMDRDVLYWALATRRLFFDIDAAPLATQAALVQVFRDDSTFSAWLAAVRPDGSRPRPLATQECQGLIAGDVFTLDGVRQTVRFVGHTGVICRNDHGDTFDLSFVDLERASLAGKLALPKKLGLPHVRSRFYSCGPDALERALRQANILDKIKRNVPLALDEQYSSSTIRRWARKIREGESKGWSPVESLIDEIASRGYRGSHIDPKLSHELDTAIRLALADSTNKSALGIYGDIERSWKERGLRMVAKSSFYERVHKIRDAETVRAAQGHKAAHQIEPAYWIIDEKTPIHGEHAMAWVHIDSTLLDIELRSSLSGSILGRPWLTLAICALTRRVLGFHISFRPPSYVSTMMVLADVVRRTGRLPDAIVHDWGSEFKAKDFKECLAALYIERFVRPKGSPRFGSVIERMFGTTTRQLIDNLVGNTKLRKNVRQLVPSVNPSSFAGLWLIDLYVGLEEYFNLYNARKHPTTLQSPDDKTEASLIAQGRRLHRVRRLEDILPIIAPMARGRTRVLDPARGLFVNYRYYSNPALAHYSLRDTDLLVRPVPFDPGLILTFFRGQWITCHAPLAPEVKNAPEVVRRVLAEEWQIEQQLASASSDETREEIVKLTEELNERAKLNQEYWADRKYRDLLKATVFPAADLGDKVTAPAKTKLEALGSAMTNAVQTAMESVFGELRSGNGGK